MSVNWLTLSRFLQIEQRKHKDAVGDLTAALLRIGEGAKILSAETSSPRGTELESRTDVINVQGEVVTSLDKFAEATFGALFVYSECFCAMASEEMNDVIPIPDNEVAGPYGVAYDPMDGFTSLGINAGFGTIFSIHRCLTDVPEGEEAHLLQPGRDIVAAGYVLYGPATVYVFSTGNGVHGFTLHREYGEFVLTHPNMMIPDKGMILSINFGYERFWHENVRQFVNWMWDQPKVTGRYIGAMVADIHRTMIKGGIFLYPADTKNPKKPNGKLRLLYECSPMGFLVNQAGGLASTGTESILDIEPFELHQRVPFIAGSKALVQQAEKFFKDIPTPTA